MAQPVSRNEAQRLRPDSDQWPHLRPGPPRYRRLAPFFASVLELVDTILVQSDDMKERFVEAGAPPAAVATGGNLKYDFTPAAISPRSPALAFIEAFPEAPLWIAASTSADEHIEEESFVLEAQQKLAGWRLILAPRKPERFDAVADRLARSGLRWTRRSAMDDARADVLLLDSIGELSGLFALSRAVFMGGTLADRGGHNILEPAIFGKPVIVGPHMENFREIAEDFERAGAMVRIGSGAELADAVLAAAADPAIGRRARAAAENKKGASERAAAAVLALYDSRYPCERDPQPLFGFLWFLSLIWRVTSAWDRRRKTARRARLPVPVVSVGNITTGGTGKTPVTIAILQAFRAFRPGMLTRGHGRTSHENVLFLNESDDLPVSTTGEEARLCMRAARVPIGIGADRFQVGQQLLEAADPGLLVLDDGSQHLQLHRDFDLVLVDALRPFGDGHLLPLGRLREPLDGLARAHAFVITRSDEVPGTNAIESVLRRYNPAAPVFRARTAPAGWFSGQGREFAPGEMPFKNRRVVAFCGLGNPQAFWKTLRRLGIEPAACYDYEDHHKYRPSEIRRLAQHARDMGADVLLTTSKDAVNLDADYVTILGTMQLYWLEIRVEIERSEELFTLIRQECLRHR